MYLLYTALNPASLQIQVRLCQKFKIKIQHPSTKMPSNGALDCAAVGAKKDSGKKRRKSLSSESDSSEDSDVAVNMANC
jgi:hypothetical protein